MENNFSGNSFFIQPSGKGVSDFDDLIERDYDVNISRWIEAGWNIFKKNLGGCISFTVLGGIVFMLLNFIPFAGIFVSAPFIAGLMVISLVSFQNKTPELKDYFLGFRYFLPLMLYSIVSTVLILIGLVVLVVPGIYLSVAYLFSPFLIVEKNLDFWPAMEVSRKKINRQFFGVFCLFLILLLLNLIGCIPMLLGLFITIPLSICILTAAYRDIFMEITEHEYEDIQEEEEEGNVLINPEPVVDSQETQT